jgi:hypothetical protein
MKYYLAYGPNLNLVQMRQRCPNARVVGYTYLFGARLVFRGSKNGCFLTTDFQQPWCPSMVGCGVYEISDKDEQALDVYAGVPYFYQKQTMQVQCVWDVTTRREVLHHIEAILYTLPTSHPLGVPSRRYLQECKSGYDDFHFSFLPLRQALIDSSPEPHTK